MEGHGFWSSQTDLDRFLHLPEGALAPWPPSDDEGAPPDEGRGTKRLERPAEEPGAPPGESQPPKKKVAPLSYLNAPTRDEIIGRSGQSSAAVAVGALSCMGGPPVVSSQAARDEAYYHACRFVCLVNHRRDQSDYPITAAIFAHIHKEKERFGSYIGQIALKLVETFTVTGIAHAAFLCPDEALPNRRWSTTMGAPPTPRPLHVGAPPASHVGAPPASQEPSSSHEPPAMMGAPPASQEPSDQVDVRAFDGEEDADDLFGAFDDPAEDALLLQLSDADFQDGVRVPASAGRVHTWARNMGGTPMPRNMNDLSKLSRAGFGDIDPDVTARPKIPWTILSDRTFFPRDGDRSLIGQSPFQGETRVRGTGCKFAIQYWIDARGVGRWWVASRMVKRDPETGSDVFFRDFDAEDSGAESE